MKTGVMPGKGKLTGRFCVRLQVPKTIRPNGIKMLGCFKSQAAAEKRLTEEKKKLETKT